MPPFSDHRAHSLACACITPRRRRRLALSCAADDLGAIVVRGTPSRLLRRAEAAGPSESARSRSQIRRHAAGIRSSTPLRPADGTVALMALDAPGRDRRARRGGAADLADFRHWGFAGVDLRPRDRRGAHRPRFAGDEPRLLRYKLGRAAVTLVISDRVMVCAVSTATRRGRSPSARRSRVGPARRRRRLPALRRGSSALHARGRAEGLCARRRSTASPDRRRAFAGRLSTLRRRFTLRAPPRSPPARA